MLNLPQNISENELRQVLCDQQARMEIGSLMQQRMSAMQRLIAKVQCLNDNEFDTAYKAFESIVDSAKNKKAAEPYTNTNKDTPEKILQAALKTTNPNQKKK